ncbi:hypothetical protein CDG81_12925 [Actinopolyspora erythraea]|uniref:Uncharacterized protein n=1 Tax=Actinopolyspora erythraea TaxID=414996 RepID=A0A099D5S2_9ACTN|nr:hypothetical protein [Actinopolyspora erythraea]ASU79039.1 hypothetical protein CDG81_12925 [Actinopolyspora erythraea]KGI81167.1 hypothetical protein IL38_13025 [Actinopolyspora erythraea]
MHTRVPAAQVIAVLASLGAATVHAVVAVEHWSVWWGYGLQFVLAATAQLGWGITAALRGSRALLGIGVALQTVLLAAWAVTRTVGQPIGPAAGVAEPVGLPDTLTVLLEIVTVVGALAALAAKRNVPGSRSRYLSGVGVGGVIVLAATAVAALTAMSGGHHGPGGHHGTETGHHQDSDGETSRHETGDHHETTPPVTSTGSPSTAPTPPAEHEDGHSHQHG